ncbi:hypothetical protein NB699_003120 [Xanthomonas sacchari]|nr:hypothetical protein [Xanthomonas sacchari]MCW0442295.1 hypothetical protein [Xanthomonas sacchari]
MAPFLGEGAPQGRMRVRAQPRIAKACASRRTLTPNLIPPGEGCMQRFSECKETALIGKFEAFR